MPASLSDEGFDNLFFWSSWKLNTGYIRKSRSLLTPQRSEHRDRRIWFQFLERGLHSPALFAGALPQKRGANPMGLPILQIQLPLRAWRWVAECVGPSSKLRGVRILLRERLPSWGQGGGWRGPWRRVSWRVVLKSKRSGLSFLRGSWQTCSDTAQKGQGVSSASWVMTNCCVCVCVF